MKKITGKVTHIGTNNAGNVDSILMNVGHSKTLTVRYNDKHFGGELIEKGSVVTFSCDAIQEVQFEDKNTGEIKNGNYLEADNFKMMSQATPNVKIHRKAINLGDPADSHPQDAPAVENDPANFEM